MNVDVINYSGQRSKLNAVCCAVANAANQPRFSQPANKGCWRERVQAAVAAVHQSVLTATWNSELFGPNGDIVGSMMIIFLGISHF